MLRKRNLTRADILEDNNLSVPAFGDDYTKYNQNYQKSKSSDWYDIYFFEI